MRTQTCYLLTRLVFALTLCAASAYAGAATPMVSAGSMHTLALQSDGTVVGWGSDQSGQLGRGTSVFATVPTAVPGFTQVKGISAGVTYMLAVKQDGTAWAWGSNSFGQLGNGTTVDQSSPVQVTGVSNAVAVSAGYKLSLALISGGTVMAWGSNVTGQIGTGVSGFALPAGTVTGVSNVTQVSAGADHALALRADGTVYAWGNNTYGQIGDGTTIARPTAVLVPGLTGVIGVVAGSLWSAALKSDGTIWVWGILTTFSSSGAATNSPRTTPMQLSGISGVASITGGADGECNAVLANGSAAQLSIVQNLQPAVYEVSGIAAVAGGYATLLLTSSHTVEAFGSNSSGEVGNGTTTDVSFLAFVSLSATNAPVTLAALANVTAISGDGVNSMALTADGTVWTWGSDSNGQLGLGAATNYSVPGLVTGLSNVTQVSAGFSHSLALEQDGTVWAWGDNIFGELGNGSTVNSSTPVQVSGLGNVIAIAAGTNYSMAVKSDGTVWGWGYNNYGELGDGTQMQRMTPVQIPGLTGFVAIAADHQTLALKQDGTLWAWGFNEVGQLGRGTTNPLNTVGSNDTPMQVPGLPAIRAMAAADYNSYAVGTDGTVWAWGLGAAGMNGITGVIGDGTTANRYSPVQITALSGAVAISARYGAAFALLSNGSVWGWGVDLYGQLGGLSSGESLVPVQITGVSNITQISAGSSFVSYLQQNDTVGMSGDNSVAELGNGTYAQSTTPVLAINTSDNGYLDLNVGQTPVVSAKQAVPFFVASTGAILPTSATVATTVKFNAKDQGITAGVYITATVPVGSPLALLAGAVERRERTAVTSNYQTLQLTPAGWQPVVNGQLTPFVSGVLGAESAALQILTNVSTTGLQGAQFCVGYGTSAQAMAASGTQITVATVPNATDSATSSPSCVTASAAAVIPQTGYWWNPAEGGRGFTIELNTTSGNVFFATYLYTTSGSPVWYAAGPAPMTGSTFSAPLASFAGGQTLNGAYQAASQGVSPGSVSIAFTDAADGTLTWPGGTIPITRYQFMPDGLNSPPTSTQPQSGYWWNPAEGGRGYTIEVQDNTAFVAAYMYDGNGNPVWYASGPAALTANNTYQGTLISYFGGETLTGAYQSPSNTTSAGNITIQFTSPTAGMLTLPDGRQIPIERYSF